MRCTDMVSIFTYVKVLLFCVFPVLFLLDSEWMLSTVHQMELSQTAGTSTPYAFSPAFPMPAGLGCHCCSRLLSLGTSSLGWVCSTVHLSGAAASLMMNLSRLCHILWGLETALLLCPALTSQCSF